MRLSKLLIPLCLILIGGSLNAQIISRSDVWKYLDDGTDQGSVWKETLFPSEATWLEGNGQFGFGDIDETTVVDSTDLLNTKITTYYFRHTFTFSLQDVTEIGAAGVTDLTFELLADDGAIVYLNGTEIARENMPSGVVDYLTLANSDKEVPEENTYVSFTAPLSAFDLAGQNTIAVEVHQSALTSNDLSFDLSLRAEMASSSPVLRGPYLQNATENSTVIQWRTSTAEAGKVWYGDAPDNLTDSVEESGLISDHLLEIEGLSPDTKYFYAIGNTASEVYAGGDVDHYFKTNPTIGSRDSFRFWVLGDPGTASDNQRTTRDAFWNFNGGKHTDMMVFLGDNAYLSGLDNEFQDAMFNNMYEDMLRNTTAWSCPGNHEYLNGGLTNGETQSGPYYDIFTHPTQGEAGGTPSGTEQYWSMDYANLHLVSLDSEQGSVDPNGPMLTWLVEDLANTNQEWIVVIFHHPPYSKGSHDSDAEGKLVNIRESYNPILDSFGVDLVFNGHSHVYERTYMMKGHYGDSDSFDSLTHVVQPGFGRDEQKFGLDATTVTCAFAKEENREDGTIYITAGATGQSDTPSSSNSLDHEAHIVALPGLSSVTVDIHGDRLDLTMISGVGEIKDYFTIYKNTAPINGAKIDSVSFSNGEVVTLTASWLGDYIWSTGAVTRSIHIDTTADTSFFSVGSLNGCRAHDFVLAKAGSLIAQTKIDFFSATPLGSGVRLDWTTSKELDTDKFIIERSIEGRSQSGFLPIGEMAAAGNSDTKREYNYFDNTLEETGVVRYRLRVLNSDLSDSIFSKPVAVDFQGNVNWINDYVEQMGGQISVTLLSKIEVGSGITIVDATGKVVAKKIFDLRVGRNVFAMDVHALTAGTYFVYVQAEGKVLAKQFVKQ